MTDSDMRPTTLRQAGQAPTTARVAIHHARAGERERFSYPVDVLRWRPCHVIVSGVFGPEVAGRSPIFRPGDVTAEFFWRDRWWNVIAGYDAGTGDLRGYYCNVAKTPRWHVEPAPMIAYTDLDLDLVVFPDGRIELHDEDEFVALRRAVPLPRADHRAGAPHGGRDHRAHRAARAPLPLRVPPGALYTTQNSRSHARDAAIRVMR